jgi:hypothetical protein
MITTVSFNRSNASIATSRQFYLIQYINYNSRSIASAYKVSGQYPPLAKRKPLTAVATTVAVVVTMAVAANVDASRHNYSLQHRCCNCHHQSTMEPPI